MQAEEAPSLRQRAEAAAEWEWRRCFGVDTPGYFIGRYVWIEDKTVTGKVSRFALWAAQLTTLAAFLVKRFVIALKARQLGFTWLVLSYAVWRMIKHPGYTVIAVSKTDPDAIELVAFRLGTVLLPRLPRWMIRPRYEAPDWWAGPVWSATKHEVTIEFPGGTVSRFKADAGPEAGRSVTADLLILDEWAANQWASDIWESAYPTINRPGDGPEAGQVFIISTNRRASLFEQQVAAARKSENEFHLIFWPWSTDPRRDLAWYEATKRNLPASYRQEYPVSIDDALSAGESTAFPEFDSREGGAHVCRPFPIPRWWRRWRSNDPGYTDSFAWYWLATDEAGENVYVYREFTRRPNEDKLTYSEQAKRVVALSVLGTEMPGHPADTEPDPKRPDRLRPVPERIDFTVTGMDAFSKHPETGKTFCDYYQQGGLYGCIEPVHGPGARSAMKGTWHEYLKPFPGQDGKPTAKLHIFSTCAQLIETLPQLVRDEKDSEKVAEMPIDHWYQGAGYGLQAWHAERSRPPKPEMGPIAAAKARALAAMARVRRQTR